MVGKTLKEIPGMRGIFATPVSVENVGLVAAAAAIVCFGQILTVGSLCLFLLFICFDYLAGRRGRSKNGAARRPLK